MSELVRRITPEPASRADWLGEVAAHVPILGVLARKEFQTRYKRASLGIIWAVGLPLLQAAVLAVVFSKVVGFEVAGVDYAAYVMSGIVAWAFFAGSVSLATTSIVDGAGLTDKVWFPRAVLPLVPVVANAPGFALSVLALLVLTPFVGGDPGVHTALVVPAGMLLVALVSALGLALAALYVYFRDVRFMVQAALLVWLYVTPIIYPRAQLGSSAGWLDLNPMTGVVTLLHAAVGVEGEPILRPVVVSVTITALLAVAALEAHRRHDRLFVDQL